MPILGTVASQFAGKPFASFESITTATVGSTPQSTVTFSAIPSTYKHLQIRGIARTNRSGAQSDVLQMYFNSDSTISNYGSHLLYGDGGSATSGYISSNIWAVYGMASASNTANSFGSFIIDILDYQNTNKFKTVRSLGGSDFNTNNTDGTVGLVSELWRNTSAISSITLTSFASFVQYSSFALYGIKG
jgi:hypothetical protein